MVPARRFLLPPRHSVPSPSALNSHDVGLRAAQHGKLRAVAAALEPEAAQLGIQVAKRGGGAGQKVQAEHLAAGWGKREGGGEELCACRTLKAGDAAAAD